jgi:predicted nucleic acid-binding protein
MADIVLDANVLVGYFDQNDALHQQALIVFERLEATGNTPLMLDFLVAEAVSVVCRRALQRKTNPPDLGAIVEKVRSLFLQGEIEFVNEDAESRFARVLDVVRQSAGVLNFNDAMLLVLQQEDVIGAVATFDEALVKYPGFQAWT